MKDKNKTKDELIKELAELRQQIAEFKNSEIQQKKYAEEIAGLKRQIEFILGATKTGLDIIDSEYNIRYIDPEWEKLYGSPAGKKCYEYFMDKDAVCSICGIEKALKTKSTVITEGMLVKENNRPIQVVTIPFQDNNGEWLVAEVNLDISERKKAEEEILKYQASLEKIVEEKSAILNETIEKLQKEIEERKRAEEILLESEEKYRSLADNSLVGIYRTTIEGEIVYINPAVLKIFECNSIGEMAALGVLSSYKNKDDRDVLLQELVKNGKVSNYKFEILTKAGKPRSVIVNATLEENLISGMMLDISELERVQGELRSSEEKYRDLYDNAPDMYYSVDKNGIIIECNATQARMLGYKKEEIIGRALPDFFTEESKRLFHQNFPQLNYLRPRISAEREFVRKDGTVFTASININSKFDQQGEFQGTNTIARDITERKNAENALRHRESFLNNILDSIKDGISILDKDLNIIRVNPMMEKWYVHKMPIIGRKCYDAYHGRTAPCKACPTLRTLNSGETDYETVTYTGPAGASGYMDVYTFPLTEFRTGEMLGVIEYVRDVTSRKNMELLLINSEKKYRRLFEDSRDAIYITSRNGRFIDVNQSALELFGYSKEEMIGMDVLNIYANQDDRIKFQKEIEEKGFVKDYEIKFCKKDGAEMDCLLTSTLWKDNEERIHGYRGVIRDITEQRSMEKELLKMAKLESIGILAGGIAHDFNNILTAIMGNIAIAMLYAKPEHELFARLVEAEKASLRARDLTQQLLTFSKGGAPVRKITSIAELIRDSATFSLSGSNVRCEFSIPDELWPVEIDEGQMSQVINNLVINADHAMPQGGTVRISAENIKGEDMEGLLKQDERYLKIVIADEGIGIPDEHLQKIFDPYFTTKEKGHGLGLAITYSIINKHDGYITVESEPGTGSTFNLYLPASKKVISEEGIKAEKGFFAGKGNILIMDDEEAILEIAGEMLREIGYDVDFALSGDEAIAKYQRAMEADRAFDAVILDLTVPGGTGGRETLRGLLDIDPDTKAVVSSGYSTDQAMANYREYGFKGVIAKPYKFSELARVIRDVLKGDASV